jgi:hypothetical protein
MKINNASKLIIAIAVSELAGIVDRMAGSVIFK